MKNLLFSTIGLIIISFLVTGQEFVGSKKCKMCHRGEKNGKVWEKWEASLHFRAFETLKKKGEDKNPKCLGCHVTAFNTGGYRVGDASAAKFEGVGCESCHGPGSKYKMLSVMRDRKRALASGMLMPDEKTCSKCHNNKNPTFKGFDYNEYSKKISHLYRKK